MLIVDCRGLAGRRKKRGWPTAFVVKFCNIWDLHCRKNTLAFFIYDRGLQTFRLYILPPSSCSRCGLMHYSTTLYSGTWVQTFRWKILLPSSSGVRNCHFQNRSLECYRYNNLLVPLLLDDFIFVKHKYFPTWRVIRHCQWPMLIELPHWQLCPEQHHFVKSLFNRLTENPSYTCML